MGLFKSESINCLLCIERRKDQTVFHPHNDQSRNSLGIEVHHEFHILPADIHIRCGKIGKLLDHSLETGTEIVDHVGTFSGPIYI